MHSHSLPDQRGSKELSLRSHDLLPARRGHLRKLYGAEPIYLERGKGCHVWDIDGNEYIDLIMGNGQVSLGYGYEAVDQAIQDQLKHGIRFSLIHPLELEIAEIIRDSVPGAESVWFCKSGDDVRNAAIRLARIITGRRKVLRCEHSETEDDLNNATFDKTADISFFTYNDFHSLESHLDDSIACVILEPVFFDEPQDNFLQRIRKLCTKNGSLLIFDEMWTGFRIAIGGAQEHFGVTADLACFSNGIANGMQFSVLSGKRSAMAFVEKDPVFLTSFGAEVIALAAAEATLNEIKDRNIPQEISYWNQCLRDGYNRIAQEMQIPYTSCAGLDHRTMITFDKSVGEPNEMKALMQLELFRRGILWNGFHNLSASHKYKDVSHVLSAYAEALSVLRCAVDTKQVSQLIHAE